ncbi:14574_t:CDS:2, partial [Gigaspora rosea]
ENKVLAQVEMHFKEQFRKRNFDVRNLKQVWQEQYKPKENIKEKWCDQQNITEVKIGPIIFYAQKRELEFQLEQCLAYYTFKNSKESSEQ